MQKIYIPLLAASLRNLSPEIADMYEFCVTSHCLPQLLPQDQYERSPLFYAISFRCPEVLEFYLHSRLYNVNAIDIVGDTPLTHALKLYNSENPQLIRTIVCILLKHGANPNSIQTGCMTPLMLAVLWEDVRIVNALLIMGADPNARYQEEGLFMKGSDTALSLAVRMHKFIPNRIQTVEQIECLHALLQNSCVRITPNVLFHALQQTKDSLLKAYILAVSK